MKALGRLWSTWVAMWSLREIPTVLGLVRLAAGLVMLWDVAWIGWLDLAPELLGPSEAGGWGRKAGFDRAWLWHVLPATEATAWWVWGAWMLALAGVATGTLTPLSCVAAAVLSAQQAALVPDADRGIDLLYRNLFRVLALSPSGATLSVDARWRTGSWLGDGIPRPAWGRHLLIVQLVVMYATAGLAKVGARWLPMQGFSALWVILMDPAVSRFPPPPPTWAYPLTQLGTAGTMVWEWSTPLLLVVFWWRHQGEAAPAWARRIVAWRPEAWWAGIGLAFHLGIAFALDLGIFPWAMLAVYPVLMHPSDLHRLAPWTRPSAGVGEVTPEPTDTATASPRSTP